MDLKLEKGENRAFDKDSPVFGNTQEQVTAWSKFSDANRGH